MIPNLPPGADPQAQLSALFASGAAAPFPGLLPAAPSPFPGLLPGALTADQVNALIDLKLRALTPAPAAQPDLAKLGAVIQQIDGLVRRALSADDYEFLKNYISEGGPGFADMLASDVLHPIAQLLCETIRERKA